MGTMVELTATDGHRCAAYRTAPTGKPRGGLVIVQEIFGVNSHIRAVTDDYAADGYLAIAPALFDRVERGFEIGYSPPEIERGRAFIPKIPLDDALKDVEAACKALATAGRIGIVGYCWGGTVAWAAAAKLDGLACAVPYYGGGIAANVSLQPKCPVMFHFGEIDHAIPLSDVDKVRTAHPTQTVHLYPAGHGFNCDQRGSYDAGAARLARTRTLEFLRKHVG